MLAMHLTGALQSPATGVVTLAWAAHKVLGDADYPARWW